MRRRRDEIAQWKKRVYQLRRSIKKLETNHSRLEKSLHNLNLQYEFGNLSYDEYLRLYDTCTGHPNAEEWQSYYNTELAKNKSELAAAERKVERIKARGSQKSLAIASALMALVLMTSVAGLIIQPEFNMDLFAEPVTGAAVSSETSPIEANATIYIYFAIARSANLTDGIEFGSIASGTSNNNATDNYATSGTKTALNITVSADSNVNVDFCVKADTDLRISGGTTLKVGNVTFNSSSTNSASLPSISSARTMNLTYQNLTKNIAAGGSDYFRFWLDVPADQNAGTYNNSVTFAGTQAGTSTTHSCT